jgi:hypothetical protein
MHARLVISLSRNLARAKLMTKITHMLAGAFPTLNCIKSLSHPTLYVNTKCYSQHIVDCSTALCAYIAGDGGRMKESTAVMQNPSQLTFTIVFYNERFYCLVMKNRVVMRLQGLVGAPTMAPHAHHA